jgi:hypothetical protein
MAETWHIISAMIAISLIFVGLLAVVLVVVRVIQSRRIEVQSAANSREVAAAMGEIKTTLYKICDGMVNGGQMNRDNQEDMRRMIGNVTILVLDVEKRLGGEIKENREWFAAVISRQSSQGNHVNINDRRTDISGGKNMNHFGDGDQS